jgi:hypothetical protein
MGAMRLEIIVVAACAAACGKGAAPGEPAAGSGSAASVGSAASGGSAGSAGSGVAPVAVAATALSPKIKAARCGEPCLFLVDTPLDKLVDTFKAECAGMETKALGFDDRKQLDYARNCIYAAHGLVYKKKKWKQVFEAKPWYEPHPDANAKTMLSAIELANVHELHGRSKSLKHNVALSTADAARLKAWLAVLPKQPPLPKLIFFNDDATSPADFLAKLNQELADSGFQPGLEPQHTTARYIDKLDGDLAGEDLPQTLREALLKMAPAPRVVDIVFSNENTGAPENPIIEGTNLVLAYDAKDQLVAVGAKHFLWD